MKSVDEVREELRREWQERSMKFSSGELEAEAYRRFHLERITSEVAVFEAEGRDYRIVFMASPGNEWCRNCWQRNSENVSLEELKSGDGHIICSCTVVIPGD